MEVDYLDSPIGPEISTGIHQVAAGEGNIPMWFSDPKFGRFPKSSSA